MPAWILAVASMNAYAPSFSLAPRKAVAVVSGGA
jgi:hypothetical protein